MKENTFLKKVNAIRKAAVKSGVVSSSPTRGIVRQSKALAKGVKKGVKKYKEGLEKMDNAKANRDWQYQMGNPNASDFDLSGPKKK